jgi:hypothetical protein
MYNRIECCYSFHPVRNNTHYKPVSVKRKVFFEYSDLILSFKIIAHVIYRKNNLVVSFYHVVYEILKQQFGKLFCKRISQFTKFSIAFCTSARQPFFLYVGAEFSYLSFSVKFSLSVFIPFNIREKYSVVVLLKCSYLPEVIIDNDFLFVLLVFYIKLSVIYYYPFSDCQGSVYQTPPSLGMLLFHGGVNKSVSFPEVSFSYVSTTGGYLRDSVSTKLCDVTAT